MASFTDKFKSGLSSTIAKVGANAKALTEKAKVKEIISNLEKEHQKLTGLLGQKIYDMHKAQEGIHADENVKSFIAEIDIRLEKIAEQQENLKRIDEELNSVTGGSSSLGANGNECKCGNVNTEGAKFCAKCGNNLQ
jgi:hypothetical protein